MFLSIIIPVYNEEQNIIEVLQKLIDLNLESFVNNYEIIVVDDCSTDNSYKIINHFIHRQSFHNLKLVKHDNNHGKGAAIVSGIKHANGDVYLFQDADLELDVKDIPRMIDVMKKMDVDFVNGSRYMEGIIRPLSSYWRYLGNKIFTTVTAMLINVKITDIACGYKLIRKELFEKLTLKEKRFGFETEIIIKSIRIARNKVVEVPVNYFPRTISEGKKLTNKDAILIFFKIIKYGLLRLK